MRHTWAPLVFKKGVMLTGGLWSWFESTLHGFKNVRRDGAVILVEPDGNPVIGWSWQAGLPVKWSGPELNAQEGAIAIQSIEIVHHGLRELSVTSLASGLVGKFT